MNTRYTVLLGLLAITGFEFFAVNRTHHLGAYEIAAVACTIAACSLALFALAINSLRSMSILIICRSAAIPALVVVVTSWPPVLLSIALVVSSIALASFFSEFLLSWCCVEIGSQNNEQTFILKIPRSISLWFTFTWAVVWATFMETIHLFDTSRALLAFASMFVGAVITLMFIRSQLRIFARRCVLVPHGIVLSDPIALTDVVLFPLSKIVDVKFHPRLISNTPVSDRIFAPILSDKYVAEISLTESTDSLIARKGVGETERINADTIFLSLADSRRFTRTFRDRFHKVEAPDITPTQEKLIEKELGIVTAPRSDAKLPQWRKKKPTTPKSSSDDT